MAGAEATLIDDLGALDAITADSNPLADAARPSCAVAWLFAWAGITPRPGTLRVVIVRSAGKVIGIYSRVLLTGRGGVHRLQLIGAATASGIERLAHTGREAEVGRVGLSPSRP